MNEKSEKETYKMLGVSLAYKVLCGAEDELLKPEILLPELWAHGVRSIEIRMVPVDASPTDVLRIATLLWDYGFQVTVHAKTQSAESAVADVFAPLSDMLAHMRQKELIITIHPVDGDNVLMLTSLSDHIIEHRYPVRIALENNRKMPDRTDGNCLAYVLDTVTRVNRPNVGTCFDMGHFAWYTLTFTDSPNMLPPQEFLSRTIHTHIHTYAEGMTHFPLDEWREPYSLYINALGHRYLGVYNLELNPERASHHWNATEVYLLSVDTLKSNYL